MEEFQKKVTDAQCRLDEAMRVHEIAKTNAHDIRIRCIEAEEFMDQTKLEMCELNTESSKESFAIAYIAWEKIHRQWEKATNPTWIEVVEAQKAVYAARDQLRNKRNGSI